MKITKYEHACVVIEDKDQKLVVDPGVFTTSLPTDLRSVVGVVITHQHADHLNKEHLQNIFSQNPNMTVFAPQDVLNELTGIKVTKVLAEPGQTMNVGTFTLDFFGRDHAVIYETIPCQNVGVLVNKSFYYPGDSFTEPGVPVKVLAVPAGAPWMKMSEAMTFIHAMQPETAFATHDVLYNNIGAHMSYNYLAQATEAAGGNWNLLMPSDSLDI